MSAAHAFDYDEFQVGLTRDETRVVARRQFIASVLVACVIACAAVLVWLIPADRGAATQVSHGLAQVQQPIFVNQGVASARQIELP